MTHRLFIAINPPQNLKDKLSRLILGLKERNANLPIKWVEPQALHLTLHFLGDIADNQIDSIIKVTDEVVSHYTSSEIKLDGLSAFPNLKNPRIIFLDCEEIKNNVIQIQKKLGENLSKAGFAIDNRPWQKHITLGRVKDNCQLSLPRVTISEGDFTVKSIELMESELLLQGPKYIIVKSFDLV